MKTLAVLMAYVLLITTHLNNLNVSALSGTKELIVLEVSLCSNDLISKSDPNSLISPADFLNHIEILLRKFILSW